MFLTKKENESEYMFNKRKDIWKSFNIDLLKHLKESLNTYKPKPKLIKRNFIQTKRIK